MLLNGLYNILQAEGVALQLTLEQVHQIFSIEPVHGALSVPLIFIALESID
jgi:hypothetical protein